MPSNLERVPALDEGSADAAARRHPAFVFVVAAYADIQSCIDARRDAAPAPEKAVRNAVERARLDNFDRQNFVPSSISIASRAALCNCRA